MYFRFHLFKKDLPLRNRALDTYATRERTTAKNVTNINSPHYRPEYVKFEEYFVDSGQVAIKGATSSGTHIPMGKTIVCLLVCPRMQGKSGNMVA